MSLKCNFEFNLRTYHTMLRDIFFWAEKQTQVVLGVLEVRDFKNDYQFFLRSPDRKLVKNTFQRLFRASMGKKSWRIRKLVPSRFPWIVFPLLCLLTVKNLLNTKRNRKTAFMKKAIILIRYYDVCRLISRKRDIRKKFLENQMAGN